MQNRILVRVLEIVFLMTLVATGTAAADRSFLNAGSTPGDDQQYAGTWTGTYSSESGGSGNVTFILSQDEEGQWRGTVKYTTDDGEQTAQLGSLKISGGKFTAKIETSDGTMIISLEGQFAGTRFEGTYSVSDKDSTEVAERGTWKTVKG